MGPLKAFSTSGPTRLRSATLAPFVHRLVTNMTMGAFRLNCSFCCLMMMMTMMMGMVTMTMNMVMKRDDDDDHDDEER